MFQARVKIKDVIVAQSDWIGTLRDSTEQAVVRFRQSGVVDWPEPLIIEVYHKSD